MGICSRQYQSGEHFADAARILNELVVARLCLLLKPDKKFAYDAKLREDDLAMALSQTPTDAKFNSLGSCLIRRAACKRTSRFRKPIGKPQVKIATSRKNPFNIGTFVCLMLIMFLAKGRNGRLEGPSVSYYLSSTPASLLRLRFCTVDQYRSDEDDREVSNSSTPIAVRTPIGKSDTPPSTSDMTAVGTTASTDGTPSAND